MSVANRQRGSAGGPLSVYTNSFAITSLPKKIFYQYDGISPEPKHPRQAQEIIDRLQTRTAPNIFQPNGVYDGKNILYVSHLLKFHGNSETISVHMSDKAPIPGVPPRGVYAVQLTHTSADTIDFRALSAYISGTTGPPSSRIITAINILQLLIRAAPNLMYPHNLRAYFSDIGKQRVNLGLELWSGYFQSVRPSMGRMLINIDTSMTAMYQSGPLLDVALSAVGARNPRDLELSQDHANFRKLKSFLKDVRVELNIPGSVQAGNKKPRRFKITGLISRAGQYPFAVDGQERTVAAHFQLAHKYTIRFPNAIGINAGRKDNPAIFPLEVCHVIPGQIYKRKLPASLSKDVVKFATKKPGDRLAAIANAPKDGTNMAPPVFEYANSRFMSDAGMTVSPIPVTIKGRLLAKPQVLYANNSQAEIRDGAWNITRSQFRKPSNLVAWAVVNFSPRDGRGTVDPFVSEMMKCFSNLNMRHLQPFVVYEANGQGNIGNILHEISQAAIASATEQIEKLPPKMDRPPKPKRTDLIFCILPFPADEIRRAVKHFGDVTGGIPTQCLRADKLKPRGLNQYCNNVALKVNIRLDGITSNTRSKALAELQKEPFMIIGADVGHPGAGVHQPSIAGLVFSHDVDGLKYVALSRVQAQRQEGIEDLQEMMQEAINTFALKNKAPPARIVFYRDGLSEGEFEGVGQLEISAIQKAIDVLWEKNRGPFKKPRITYIIVGKRHHVRFFPQQGGGDKTGNCPAGFVADEGIDSPLAADFFLLSHGGLLGTSRPSHYTVLRDDIYGNHPDALQELSFTLCHCYAKATRSVSIPAPVYYADLVCERAKFHFDPNLGFDHEGTVSSGDGKSVDLTPWKAGYKMLHPAMQRSMYFL